MNKKYVYSFGGQKADTCPMGEIKNLLGGKGAGLVEMTRMGIPVPPGFTITTEACLEFFRESQFPQGMFEQARKALKQVETLKKEQFGDPDNPLLVSVRSGARASMPGMMDTVLNLGLNDQTVLGLIQRSQNERFGYDAYRRFVAMFGSVVMGVRKECFDRVLTASSYTKGAGLDEERSASELKEIVALFKEIVLKETGHPFPESPMEQLKMAIAAVFNSWNGARAVTYRRINNIPDDWGTSVSVVAMIFGNRGDHSGTGVVFTRNPNTGERKLFGEFLFNAQGEDVVAGIRTPLPIVELQKKLPKAYKELLSIFKKLEYHYKDMLDLEFTIEEEKPYLLQTRVGKRSAGAAVAIAVDLVKEKLITRETALMRVSAASLDCLLHPMVDPSGKYTVVAKGLPASPGAAVGRIVFSAEEAQKRAQTEKVILVRPETSPEDIGGMHVAQGIITARGGMTSHAAVVARGMGKCCITGCGALKINEHDRFLTIGSIGEITLREGDVITLNGSTGEVILGDADLVQPEMNESFKTLMRWADATRSLAVRTNADTPADAKVARAFGAEGIGLCRTEHMFFDEQRILSVRQMILSNSKEERKGALAKLRIMQKNDFLEIFTAMDGLPVTVRLLDPPLHEFIPKTESEITILAEEMELSFERLKLKIAALSECNPMLGHRGCRLGITYPDIYEMQVEAIFEAACELKSKKHRPVVEVMIPLIADPREFSAMKSLVIRVANAVMKQYGVKIAYTLGTMIELPRAVMVADEIARDAEFFSFGTNDLTQTTFGLSRDDSGSFLPQYIQNKILDEDPFAVLDRSGVGALMKIGVEKGRKTRPALKIGICGEHGGDPSSVEFCHQLGLNYVSCSPYRVPIARLAAAQATLKNNPKGPQKRKP